MAEIESTICRLTCRAMEQKADNLKAAQLRTNLQTGRVQCPISNTRISIGLNTKDPFRASLEILDTEADISCKLCQKPFDETNLEIL